MSRRPSARTQRPAAPVSAAAIAPARAGLAEVHSGVMAVIREWVDALVIAFVATMFFRVFFVELFKIPSGSMTPTLVGGTIATVDLNHDGRRDMVCFQRGNPLVFINDGRRLIAEPDANYPLDGIVGYERYDRILVNKMAYWFHQPRRGDIVVFKVPPSIFEKDKPIYIKRCVGLPGEVLSFDSSGHLIVDGKRVTDPGFFLTQRYIPFASPGNDDLPEVSYGEDSDPGLGRRLQSIHVPGDKIYTFGDNTANSADSRYWGGVPLVNVKGRAFFRYWPLSEIKFFKGS